MKRPPRPLLTLAAKGVSVGSANKPIATIPQTPQARWTGEAPTASSILIFSKKSAAKGIKIPATAPTIREAQGLKKAQPPVTATKPAKEPFMQAIKSHFPVRKYWKNNVAKLPIPAPSVVLRT